MFKKVSWRKISLHALGIIGFFSLPVLFYPRPSFKELLNNYRTVQEVVTYILMVAFFYLNYFKLIPKFYFPRQRKRYATVVLVCFLMVVVLPDIIFSGTGPMPPNSEFHQSPNITPPSNFDPPRDMNGDGIMNGPRPVAPIFNVLFLGQNLILFLGILFFSLMLQINNRLKATEKERLNAEISYLKAQINPHFLFNTLNGIYALALQKSNDTANAVVKLSNMMRYVLTEASAEMVSLDKEMEYLKNYIELQKIRFGNSMALNFQVMGDTSGKMIAPLLIIPLVENAFKYGVSPEEKSEISIEAEFKTSYMRFAVSNKKVNVRSVEKTGLGLENVRKRLALVYPNLHEFNIAETSQTYVASLTLLT